MAKERSVLEQATGLTMPKDRMAAKKVSRVRQLLEDEERMELLATYASSGASLATIEAAMGLKEGLLKQWSEKGKQHSAESSSPYRKVYDSLRKAIAEARLVAENSLRDKNPEKWLEKNSAARVVEQVEAPTEMIVGSESRLSIGKEFLVALQVLRDQGYSLDEMMDGGRISIEEKVEEVG